MREMTKLGLGTLLFVAMAAALPAQQQGSSTTPAAGTQPKSAAEENPFPEDTHDVPLMPNQPMAPLPDADHAAHAPESPASDSSAPSDSASLPILRGEVDPVSSPDDEETPAAEGSSSSLSGLDKLMPKDEDDERHGKKRKLEVKHEPTHQEAASKDIEVGKYYIETKNWKAALSRFESAVILDPENPDVYWGLAVAQHHLGQFAEAKANYNMLLAFDPDGPHGREARKALKEPALASAPDPKQ